MPTLEHTPEQATPRTPIPAGQALAAASPDPEPDWLVDVTAVRKKYCRNLRKSLFYGLTDVVNAMLLRRHNTTQLREHEFWAVDNVSFRLGRGDSLGLLGRNGAGKSTLLKMITGQRSLSAGTIRTRGRMVALTDLGVGFNPALTGRENIYVNAAVHGVTRDQINPILETIIDFSGVREFIDAAVQTYSTGMRARLGFSVATHLKPDILVVDEVLAVGDLDFRRKCIRHILTYLKAGGCVIFVAHDPYLIQSICNRCIILERGKPVFDGSSIDGVNFHFQTGHASHQARLDETRRNASQTEALQSATLQPADLSQAERAEADQAAELAGIAGPASPIRRSPRNPDADQPVVLDDMQVLSLDQGPLQTGKPAKVILHYRAAHAIDIGWAFTIVTADLQTSIASCLTGLDDKTIHIQPGEGTLEAILPDFPLLPAVYALRAGIADPISNAAISARGYQDAPHFFTVTPRTATRAANFGQINGDLVALKVQWL
jgi:ABC-type polysaccharide/polyol phosphate transport system ATPase subunit